MDRRRVDPVAFLIGAGLLAAAAAVLAILPLKPCDNCCGVGRVTFGEYRYLEVNVFRSTPSEAVRRGARDDSYWKCEDCSGRGRIRLTATAPSLLMPGRPIPSFEDDICPLVAQLRTQVPPAAIR